MEKVFSSFGDAVSDIFDGAVIMVSGFGGTGGTAQNLIVALRDHGASNLTIISNTAGLASLMGFGTLPGHTAVDCGILIDNDQVDKLIASYPVSPSPSKINSFESYFREGKIGLELVPQGTLAERIRAGGAGIPAFFTPTGVGTELSEGKEMREFDGRSYIMETALKADFALVKAHKADTLGNLSYKGTSQNFGAVMVRSSGISIVEVDEIVTPGEIESHLINTPALFVDRIVKR